MTPPSVLLARLSATLEELHLAVLHGPPEALPGLVTRAQRQTEELESAVRRP